MKKSLLLLLVTLSVVCVQGLASVKIGELYYDLDSSTKTAKVARSSYRGNIVIPPSVVYSDTTYAVTSIGEYAFYNCQELFSISIPNSVINIGKYAFSDCYSLASIHIPNSVTSIGECAFFECSSLSSVTIPKSVTTIGRVAFLNCHLTSISVENGNTSYDSRNNCNAIIETATNTLIQGCNTTVIPDNVTSIGYQAFYNYWYLTSITIPNSVTSIEKSAFEYCRSLTSVTIPNSVISIGRSAFESCGGLADITIGKGVTNIGEDAFRGCIGLTSIVVDSGNTSYDSRDNCNAIVETATNTLIQGCNTTVIPNGITSIGGWAFNNCSGLTSISIPGSVETIGWNAFSYCTGLTSAIINDGVTSIGNYAFEGCTSLSTVVVPNSVTDIGYKAFSSVFNIVYKGTATGSPWGARCINGFVDGNFVYEDETKTTLLACRTAASDTISIPNSVTVIGKGAFQDCANVTAITIPNGVTSIGERAFSNCISLTTIVIPNGVTSIGSHTFDGCKNLESITIPNSVTSIGDYAFIWCKKLQSIVIPNDVTIIGDWAFAWCEGLADITIPNKVTSIGAMAFYQCTSLATLTIPNSVTNVGDRAFEWSGLAYVSISEGMTYIGYGVFMSCFRLATVVIPNGITSIGRCAFESCNSLVSVTLPNSVTSIDAAAFYNCRNLTSITIPNSVTSIGESAFYNCRSLATITIPNSVISIGGAAFSYCKSLASLFLMAETPPVADKSAFDEVPIDISIYIPCGTKDVYLSADTWNGFTNYIEHTGYTLIVRSHDDAMGTAKITKEATCTNNESMIKAVANEGYKFVQWSDGNTNNPRTVILESDTVYIAEFSPCQYTITATCDPQQGVVTGVGTYDYGTQVKLTATANEGYEFSQWSNGVTDNPYLFTATENLTLEAQFLSLTTAVENVSADGITPQKVFRNGQVYILRGDNTYTTMGVEVK